MNTCEVSNYFGGCR